MKMTIITWDEMREHLEKEHLAAHGMEEQGLFFFFLENKICLFNDDDDDDNYSNSSQHSLNICPALFWLFCHSQLWVNCKIHFYSL